MTLFAGDVFDALLMAATCKLGVEEFVETLTAYVLGDESAREDDDVGVVVLTDEVGNLGLPNKTGTDALVLVDFAFLDAFSQSMAIGGVVAGLFGVGAVVLVLVAFLLKIFLDELF